MEFFGRLFSLTATIISALVASSPSTSASVENFQMPRSERSSVAFMMS